MKNNPIEDRLCDNKIINSDNNPIQLNEDIAINIIFKWIIEENAIIFFKSIKR